ncbi:hypothetical protein SCLCIDRAFT_866024 [Scleroderma citrinum Foug A]|uniref:Uncharacterized protein n=1 Tax=Scleroderma citrinum Foug A TaxID=1036808 RepID=A0A0C3E0T4_9AGAM|nr:hypothetical protein SCLCIDRAFT_866024 [Scleroderma citrinum Foug A]
MIQVQYTILPLHRILRHLTWLRKCPITLWKWIITMIQGYTTMLLPPRLLSISTISESNITRMLENLLKHIRSLSSPESTYQNHISQMLPLIHAALSKELTDRLLQLVQRVRRAERFTLHNYKDVENSWKAASHREPEPRQYPMYHRSLWDWATCLLKDPMVGPYFNFDAQRLSKFDGDSFVRFIDEPWTANQFWDVQVCG